MEEMHRPGCEKWSMELLSPLWVFCPPCGSYVFISPEAHWISLFKRFWSVSSHRHDWFQSGDWIQSLNSPFFPRGGWSVVGLKVPTLIHFLGVFGDQPPSQNYVCGGPPPRVTIILNCGWKGPIMKNKRYTLLLRKFAKPLVYAFIIPQVTSGIF